MDGRRRFLVLALVILLAARLSETSCGADVLADMPPESAHPRLLFDREDIHALRAKVQSEGIAREAMPPLMDDAERFMQVNMDEYVFHGAVAGRAFTKQVLTLAMAGLVTGDRAFIDKAIAVLCAVTEQSDPERFAGLNDALAVGDAVHGHAVGHDWLAPWMTEEQRALSREVIHAFGRWLHEHSQTAFWGADEERRMAHNWNAVTHGGLGLAALVLGDEPAWLDRAVERVRAYFRHSHDSTGAGYEGVTYLGYGLQNTAPFAVALARQGGPDLLAEEPSLRRVPDYILWQVLPWGGAIMPINQSGNTLQPAGGVFHLVNRFEDRVGLWGWLRLFGPEGDGTWGASTWLGNGVTLPYVVLWVDPELTPLHPRDAGLPLSRFFERGQVSARDGWSDNDTLVTFTSGRGIPGVWNHGDENSFTFCARGEAFAVDPGAGWGNTSEHNAILVDGIGQGTDGGPAAVQGRIVRAEDRGDSVLVIGDATEAYLRSTPLRHALRTVLFVRAPQPYLVIADDIRKDDEEREYSWLLHSDQGNEIAVIPGANAAEITGARRGTRCRVRFLSAAGPISLETSLARDRLPLLTAKVTAVNPRFLVLLVASDPHEDQPTVTVAEGPQDTRIMLQFADGTRDTVAVSAGDMRLVSSDRGRQ